MSTTLRTVLAFTILSSLIACKTEKKAEPGFAKQGDIFWTSYEAKQMGCETGRHTFEAQENQQLLNDICASLANNSANKNCAADQRHLIFYNLKCGEWPHSNTMASTTNFKEYVYETESCGTGRHIVAAHSETQVKELYCDALADDQLNLNCARAEREKTYFDNECDQL